MATEIKIGRVELQAVLSDYVRYAEADKEHKRDVLKEALIIRSALTISLPVVIE